MPLSDEQLNRIKRMSDDDLIRGAQTEDIAVGVASNVRLKRATSRLTGVLIILTVILVVVDIVPLIKPAYHYLTG